jgi:hypothetical protein
VLNKKNSAFFWYAILAILYLVLSLVLPVNQHTLSQLHLSMYQYRVLVFVILIPYILIWFTAFFAYVKIRDYTTTLGKEREAPAFAHITKGVQVMAWGLAVPAIISTILKAIAVQHASFSQAATIISSYLTLIVPLIAFTFISDGSRILSNLVKVRPGKNGMRIFALLFIIFGVYYTVLTLTARYVHGNPYHLSHTLTMFTIIIPYLYAWFMGFMGCYEIILYAKKIKGLLYKRALNRLAAGIGVVIGSSIFIQFINVVYAYKDNSSLGSLIVLIYMLLISEAIGYVLIVIGAKSLKRIEEI